MKTKIIILLVLTLQMARSQIVPVDLTTVHSVSGGTITGDPLSTAFTKLNASVDWLKNYCNTNSATNSSLAFQLSVLTTNLLNTSNLVLTVRSNANVFPAFTNTFFPDYSATKASVASNAVNLASVSNLVESLPGTNIQAGTVNSNAFDSSTLSWLQSCDVAGVLTDNGNSTGTSGYVAKANGDGTWTWGVAGGGTTYPTLTDDGGSPVGHVGFNNSSPGYALDVQGDGYITAELLGRDQNRAAFLFGSTANGVQYEFGIDSSFSGVHDFYIYDSSGGGFIMQIDSSHNTTFGANLIVPGSLNSDSGAFYTDGSGNAYANTFNPTSDRRRKENIKQFDSQTALKMALAMTNYTWRFKGSTNYTAKISRSTNSTLKASVTATTNMVAKVSPAGGMEYGPMAQDWNQVTGLGGGTNISLTSMNGLLLGAIQGLNQKLAEDEQTISNLAIQVNVQHK